MAGETSTNAAWLFATAVIVLVKVTQGQQQFYYPNPYQGQQVQPQIPPLTNDIISGPEWNPDTSDVAKISSIDVKCAKNGISVTIAFDRPFNGIVFSKGYYSNPRCIHVQPSSGLTVTTFSIDIDTCGLKEPQSGYINNGQPNPDGASLENTIVIQYDPRVQEVWDKARKIKCTWYDFYEKSVTFKPFNVNMLNAITANFLGDSLQCWMQIQVGKGPWASEVSGIVKIGQTMTMVLGIKDPENKFDMMVRDCVAHDGRRPPIRLVDDRGCVIRKKIMSEFQKVDDFGAAASVVSYAYFQAFKFPDSVNVHFQCVIQVCRFSCPQVDCNNNINVPYNHPGSGSIPQYANQLGRQKRSAELNDTLDVPATSTVQVLDPSELKKESVSKSQDFFSQIVTNETLIDEVNLCIRFDSYSGIALSTMLFIMVSCSMHAAITCSNMARKK